MPALMASHTAHTYTHIHTHVYTPTDELAAVSAQPAPLRAYLAKYRGGLQPSKAAGAAGAAAANSDKADLDPPVSLLEFQLDCCANPVILKPFDDALGVPQQARQPVGPQVGDVAHSGAAKVTFGTPKASAKSTPQNGNQERVKFVSSLLMQGGRAVAALQVQIGTSSPSRHPERPSHPTTGIAGCSSAQGRGCGNVWVPGVRRSRRHRPTGGREAATRASSAWSQGASSSQDGPGSCGHVQHAGVAKSSNGTHMRGRAVHQPQLRVTSSHTHTLACGTACQAGDCCCTSGCKGGHPKL